MTNSIIKENRRGFTIYRYEDLVSSVEPVQQLFALISDNQVTLPDETIRRLQRTPVGTHAFKKLTVEEIYDSWSDDFREAYHTLVTKDAMELYKQYGYDFLG